MGKLVGLLLLMILTGAGIAAYNLIQYGVLQPVPLAWTHRSEEVQLLDLLRARRALATKLGAGRRVMSLVGAPLDAPDGQDDALRTELAQLDRRIEALQTRVRFLDAAGR